jgi:hypothetical protein
VPLAAFWLVLGRSLMSIRAVRHTSQRTSRCLGRELGTVHIETSVSGLRTEDKTACRDVLSVWQAAFMSPNIFDYLAFLAATQLDCIPRYWDAYVPVCLHTGVTPWTSTIMS